MERKELSHLGHAHNDSPLKYYQIEAIDLSASGEKSAEKPMPNGEGKMGSIVWQLIKNCFRFSSL